MKLWLLIASALTIMVTAQCCSPANDDLAPRGNAMYYWRTKFSLSPAERKFLSDNNIKSLYVKFFDVVADGDNMRPEATMLIADSFPRDVEIIPVVFIDSRAFSKAAPPPDLASLILRRVDDMMTSNGYKPASELQIDFDWTQTNREQYFKILSCLADSLHSQNRKLSTTIRLHQLSQPVPPVDYGALMVYNTGDFSNPSESNSILSTAAVRPYLKYLKNYSLPLATALPIYSWNLLFHSDSFVAIIRNEVHADTSLFAPLGPNHFIARTYMPLPTAIDAKLRARITPGDVVRHESVSVELLDSVKTSIGRIRPDALQQIILYHLDNQSFINYDNKEFDRIFSQP
ncbi:MAG: hypothetical protein NC338_00405 [Firmicutes bacterium]|nr:hypothetical protein [Bacillota bacterium]MCM1400581.1 hypothetical protein [Bacteroides sp.]MCM1477492.1 hypothetical protein [Bacteroides sp.]